MSRGRDQPKRQKTTNSSTYHDVVPSLNEYSTIYTSDTFRTQAPEISAHADLAWNETTSWEVIDDPNFALDPDGDWYDEAVEGNVMETSGNFNAHPEVQARPAEKTKSKRSRRPHVVWKEQYRQSFLEEECRWEGRGDFLHAKDCSDCIARRAPERSKAEYRCRECFLPDLLCKTCCVKRHRLHPFHRIARWDGIKFIPTSLKSLGLEIHLNHTNSCEVPTPCHARMLVLHTNGIHEVSIQYCGCTRVLPHYQQLLRRGLYPATQVNVKTCVTFQLLQQFHLVSLTTKTSTYDLYRALEKMTSNTGLAVPKSRYRAFFRVMMQWRHLKLLKRAGRAHSIDPDSAANTQNGELAILCPSCPRPGINLPNDWHKAPVEIRFLYAAILCMDANFRLKNQMVSNWSQDPGFGIGWAYMIPMRGYDEYVRSRMGDEDISSCVGLQALAKAYTKYCEGQRFTGVGAVCCGRSEMLLPMAVGNLQKGERYANMDYAFGSSLLSLAGVLLVLISYDIACQWFVNLHSRIEKFWPEGIKPDSSMKLAPAIPKLHQAMHGQSKNHEQFSLNLIPGVGASDCECPERIWAPHNPLGSSTKLQGPGTRQDTLDDHWGFWNWLKYSSLGVSLAKKYKAAVAERNIQAEGHRGLTASLDASGSLTATWETMCATWDAAPFPKTGIESPYEAKIKNLSETQVRKELAEEESKRVSEGGIVWHTTSASMFLILALELEESQRRLQRLVKVTPKNATARKESGITEQRNQLRSRIRAWEQLHPIYMPGLLQYLTTLNAADAAPASMNEKPEAAKLWLPSIIPATQRGAVCQEGLPEIEERLRTVQCNDALENIRHTLKIKTRMIAFKNKNLRGQREGTRSRAVIDRVHGRARASAAKYRAARAAKLSLSGPGSWELTLRELHDSDIRSYQDPNRLKPKQGRRGVREDDDIMADGTTSAELESAGDLTLFRDDRNRRDGTGESRRTLSWIWITQHESVNQRDGDNDTILRSEWAKSRARAARSREEVMLLKEEMRRTLAFLAWKAKWWRERADTHCESASPDIVEALKAYAHEQAGLQESLSASFQQLWALPLSTSAEEQQAVGLSSSGANNSTATTAMDTTNDDEDDEDDDEGDNADDELDEDDVDNDIGLHGDT